MLGSSVNDARGSFVAGDVLAPVLNHSTIAQRSAGKTKGKVERSISGRPPEIRQVIVPVIRAIQVRVRTVFQEHIHQSCIIVENGQVQGCEPMTASVVWVGAAF